MLLFRVYRFMVLLVKLVMSVLGGLVARCKTELLGICNNECLVVWFVVVLVFNLMCLF